MPPDHRLARLLEDDSHQGTTHEYAQHRAPRGDAHPQQEDGTDGNGDDRGLTDRAGDEAEDIVADTGIGIDALGDLSERSGCGEAVRQGVTQSEDRVLCHPYGITRHLRRIGEGEEHTCSNGGIEDIHTRSTEDLLTEDDTEGAGQSQHPQRTSDRDNQRDDDTRYEITLLDLLTLPLGPGKLDAQTNDITDEDLRQYGEEAEAEDLEEASTLKCTCSQIVLVADIIHAKQHGRHQGDDHHTHDTL